MAKYRLIQSVNGSEVFYYIPSSMVSDLGQDTPFLDEELDSKEAYNLLVLAVHGTSRGGLVEALERMRSGGLGRILSVVEEFDGQLLSQQELRIYQQEE